MRYCKVCGVEGRRVAPTSHQKNGYQISYCSEHWAAMCRGKYKHPLGTRVEDSKGYMSVSTETGMKAEHRMVMVEKLGRELREAESVHHINGIRNDNRPENLELWVGPIRYGQRASDIVCGHCGKPYLV